jgi:ketosteroid isomerase-like protein
MTAANSKAIAEAEILKFVNDWANAVRSKDVNRAISSYAPGIVSFDVVGTLQKIGLDEWRKRAEEWFSSFQGPIGYEVRDLNITASENAAFCHSLNRVNGLKTDGGTLEMWWRSTVCYKKIDGKWMVTHEHSSAPFDAMTGRAQLDLKP